MGRGNTYKCEKCDEVYNITLGVGMLYPIAYEELIEEIKSGAYGDDWKELFLSWDFVVADAKLYFYYCESCGQWEVSKDASLYAPNDVESLKKEQFGEKTVEEWGYVPYADTADDETYHLLKKRIHVCLKCNSEMTRYNESQLNDPVFNELGCPECGTINPNLGMLFWD